MRGRRGEGPVPAKLTELVEDRLALKGELTFAGGHDVGEAPIDGSEAADEVEFGFVDGLEAANEGLEEVVESVLVFAAEDASELGVAAVLEAVHGGTGLALGRIRAARPCAVAPGGFELFVSESDKGHDSRSVGIVAGEV
ncbi:MAG: hypothetical protein ABFD86_21725, partial [Bryobacteraceae bacterium]